MTSEPPPVRLSPAEFRASRKAAALAAIVSARDSAAAANEHLDESVGYGHGVLTWAEIGAVFGIGAEAARSRWGR